MPSIPKKVLRTAFARRAAGEKVASIARDLGLRKIYLAAVLRGEYRPDLFIELGPSLSPASFTPERHASAKARAARKTARLRERKKNRRKREARRAAVERRAKERLTRRIERRGQYLARGPREIPPERRKIDEELVARLIRDLQSTGDPAYFEQIIAASLKLIRAAVGAYFYLWRGEAEMDELINEVVLRLSRVLPTFDPDLAGGVFTFFSMTTRYHLLNLRSRILTAKQRTALVPAEVLESRGGFYRCPELPNEFRERLTGFICQFSAPEEVTIARYVVEYLLLEERLPSARAVKSALGTSVAFAHVVGRLRRVFAEDWQDNYKRFAAFAVLSGTRLRVEIWVISAKAKG